MTLTFTRFLLAVLVGLNLFILSTLPAFAADIAGTVARQKGPVTAIGNNAARALTVGSKIFVGDTIVTKEGGRVKLDMIDEASVTLGEKSEFLIEDYLFDQNRGVGNVAMRVVIGTFRAVSGKATKLRSSSFALNSPVATIGIRGTDFWGGPLDGVYEIALLSGKAIIIENAAGRVEINQPGFGTRVEGLNVAPTAPVQWAPDKLQRAVDTVSF